MIIEIVAYELVTTVGGLLGFKMLTGDSINKRLQQGINQPKRLPVIDKFLKRQIGDMSKQEQYLSLKAVKFINQLSRYQAFRYLLVIIARRANEVKNKNDFGNTSRRALPGRLSRSRILAV